MVDFNDVTGKLKEYKEMLDAGILTQEEFDGLKSQLLSAHTQHNTSEKKDNEHSVNADVLSNLVGNAVESEKISHWINVIEKNASWIFPVLMLILMAVRFIVSKSGGAESGSVSVYKTMLGLVDTSTGKSIGGAAMWAWITFLMPVLMLAVSFVTNLKPYQKYVEAGAPIVAILAAFLMKHSISSGFDGSYSFFGIPTGASDTSGFGFGGWMFIIVSFIAAAYGIFNYLKQDRVK